MKPLENYCELCQNITRWTPERVEIAGQMEDMLRCLGSNESCPHYSTREYLKTMAEKEPVK